MIRPRSCAELAPNNRLHTDAALRASANGPVRFACFLSQHGFQADLRAARSRRRF